MIGFLTGAIALLTNVAFLCTFCGQQKAATRFGASRRAYSSSAAAPLPRRLTATWDALVRAPPDDLSARLERLRKVCADPTAAPAAAGAVGVAAAFLAQHRRECVVAYLVAEARPSPTDASLARRAARVLAPAAGVQVLVADADAMRLARVRARRDGVRVREVFAPRYGGRGRRMLLVGPARRGRLRRALAGNGDSDWRRPPARRRWGNLV